MRALRRKSCFFCGAAAGARYIAWMCTASLTLAPPRLIQGRGAACHWMSRDLLRRFGAEPLAERVVIDG